MKEKTETTVLSKGEVSFAGITFNMEGPEAFVREGWEYLRNQLLPHLEKTLRGAHRYSAKKTKEARGSTCQVL